MRELKNDLASDISLSSMAKKKLVVFYFDTCTSQTIFWEIDAGRIMIYAILCMMD